MSMICLLKSNDNFQTKTNQIWRKQWQLEKQRLSVIWKFFKWGIGHGSSGEVSEAHKHLEAMSIWGYKE